MLKDSSSPGTPVKKNPVGGAEVLCNGVRRGRDKRERCRYLRALIEASDLPDGCAECDSAASKTNCSNWRQLLLSAYAAFFTVSVTMTPRLGLDRDPARIVVAVRRTFGRADAAEKERSGGNTCKKLSWAGAAL